MDGMQFIMEFGLPIIGAVAVCAGWLRGRATLADRGARRPATPQAPASAASASVASPVPAPPPGWRSAPATLPVRGESRADTRPPRASQRGADRQAIARRRSAGSHARQPPRRPSRNVARDPDCSPATHSRSGLLLIALALSLPSVPASAQASPGGSDAVQVLSFEQARSRLLEVSDALAASEANVDNKRELQQASRSLRLPDVSLDVRELKFKKSLDVDLGSLAPVVAPLGVPATVHLSESDWRFRPSVSASLPLYAGGQISAAQQAARAAVREAEAEHDDERQSQTLRLVQTYFGQQLAAWALQIRGDVRDGLQQHLDDAGKLERGGLATKAQRLQATVARDQAERDFQRARNDLDTVTATLRRLLRSERDIGTSTALFVISRPPGELASFQQAARDHQPVLARLQAVVDQADQGVRAQEARLKPQVFLFGQRDLYRDDALLTDPDWVFGIGLKYDLFSSRNRPRQIGAARAQREQAEAGLREAQNQVAIGVTNAWNQLETARQQFLLLDSAIAQSRENLRLQELSFREGQATSLDVIDARLRLGSASIERAQAAYQYDVALAQLLEISGQMDRFHDYAAEAEKVVSP